MRRYDPDVGGPASDAVPEADRLEQEAPRTRDEPESRRVPIDASEADAFEQDLPLGVGEKNPGIDAERIEPFADEDWGEAPGS